MAEEQKFCENFEGDCTTKKTKNKTFSEFDLYFKHKDYKDIINRFCVNIKKFSDDHGNEFLKPINNDSFWIAQRRLHDIICNHEIERYHFLINNNYLDTFHNINKSEGDIGKWFRNNCNNLGFSIMDYNYAGIDYGCRYNYLINYLLYSMLPFDIFNLIHGRYMHIELEYLSSNFLLHKHPVDLVDMIICYRKDKDIYYNIPEGHNVQILELNH